MIPGERHGTTKDILCAMFVPPSHDSRLLEHIEAADAEVEGNMDWNIKIVEQAGVTLGRCFIP